MTTEHEALGWVRGEPVWDSWDSEPYATWTLPPSTIPYEIPMALEAAIRAQVDEDVRRLVEAAHGVMDSYEAHVAIRDPKPEDQWDEYDTMVIPQWRALVAALEPFKAVAPTGSEEVNGNG